MRQEKKERKTKSIRVSEDTHRSLKIRCAEGGIGMADLLEDMVEKHVEEYYKTLSSS